MAEESEKGVLQFTNKEQLLPQEEMLETVTSHKKLTIGIPKEILFDESRVSIVPEGVRLLIENGHRVFVENNAGVKANFSNQDYVDSGATMANTAAEIYKSDIIVKIAPPTIAELDMFSRNQTLFSSVQLHQQSKEYFEKLFHKRIMAIAYEYIKDKTGALPVVRSMSEIVGNTSIVIAAEYLSNFEYGKGIILGGFPGIKPTEVVIIGAGTVAEYAARAALGMGATVKIFDNSTYKLRAIQKNVGTRIFTSILQPSELESALINANVVIAAKYYSEGKTPCFISEETVKKMKRGSVIIDISIDQGGCFETSKPTTLTNPVFKKYDVTHYCVPNVASRVPHTASWSLNNFITPLLLNIADVGGVTNYLKRDDPFSKGVYVFNGTLTKKQIGDRFDLRYRDLGLLLAAFR